MSLAKPARCLFARRVSYLPRCLHSSAQRLNKDSSSRNTPTTRKETSIQPKKDPSSLPRPGKYAGLSEGQVPEDVERRVQESRKQFRAYTAEDRKRLEEKYTPEQMAALEAGEEAVDLDDVSRQGALRRDSMSLYYIDDFSKIDPVLDKRPKPPVEHYDPKLKFKTDEDFADDWAEFLSKLPEDADRVELQKFIDNTRMTVGKPEAELEATDYSAPELPKLTDPLVRSQAKAMARDDAGDELLEDYERLRKQTGLSVRTMRRLRVKRLLFRSVVNQTRLGKIRSQYVLTVAGNENGWLGLGEGKAAEALDAMKISLLNAIRNLAPIPRYENRTIYGDVKGKVGATELTLYTRPPGFGVRCQSKVYEMARCAGISDLAARVTRGRNPMNTIKATYQALLSQKNPEQIARARGKKLVDVRKVYYAGNV